VVLKREYRPGNHFTTWSKYPGALAAAPDLVVSNGVGLLGYFDEKFRDKQSIISG
jgi:hypothetical protein